VNNKISEKDKKNWEDFLSSDEKLPNKDAFKFEENAEKTRLLDLHGKGLDEANRIIKNFIKQSYQDKIRKLTIITGKGLHSNNEKDPYVSKNLGILKYSIPEFLKNNSELMKIILEFKEADIKDGGSGAFYIFLKKNKSI
tara:strand:- start:116 stop:535 length:420 start_codon:yes stop_codon:yes gene_type:complete